MCFSIAWAGLLPESKCAKDSTLQAARSKEIQEIVQADQADRDNFAAKPLPSDIDERDTARRQRIASIFAEGCFQSADDYSASALVFQHGNMSDHYFQTFLWSKKAVELGDTSKKRRMALGLDRYLVAIGHKQLFASQAYKTDSCWCLQPVESSFLESMRQEYMGNGLKDQFIWVDQLNKGSSCPTAWARSDRFRFMHVSAMSLCRALPDCAPLKN